MAFDQRGKRGRVTLLDEGLEKLRVGLLAAVGPGQFVDASQQLVGWPIRHEVDSRVRAVLSLK
jgi:hypothetical protein